MSKNLELVAGIGLVPVIVLKDSKDAVPLAKALVAGGIPIAEVTFRTAAAAESIRLMSEQVPEILVGAGTVHNVENAKLAVKNGAKFIVTAGYNEAVVDWCIANGIEVFPGCVTPANLECVLDKGLPVAKFFPAEAYGGTKTLKAFAGPYGTLKFMPTGGINENNVNDYLALPNVVACGGAWMAPEKLVETGEFDKITELCRNAVAKTLGFEVLHVGINTKDEAEGSQVADALCGMFALPKTATSGAYFAGTLFEVMKGPFLGENGHVAIGVNSVERGMAYLKSKGIAFAEETAARDAKGVLQTIYLKDMVGGFALHLKRK